MGGSEQPTSIRPRLHCASLHSAEMLLWVFPLPSLRSSHGRPATQPPLRRLHSGAPLCFDLAGASLCATRASSPLRKWENAFLRPMNANPARRNLNPLNGRTRHHAAYFANCNQKRFTAPSLSVLSITMGRPPVSERRYEGGNLHLTDQNHAQRKENRPCNDTPPNQRPTFPSGQLC